MTALYVSRKFPGRRLEAVPPAAAFNTRFPGSPRSAVGVGVPSTGKPIRS
jgi:hypothetical protein